MTTEQLTSRIAIALGLALALGATGARASNPCIDDAKQTFTECKDGCKEGYQVAKDACLNRDHDCVEGCRAGREECVLASNLDEDLTACRDSLRDAKATCRANNAEGSDALDQCIDQAQVVAFLCRKAARQSNKPAIAACRAGFRGCARACPPGSAGTAIDPVQCKLDAKNGYLQCKADCREGFQQQKDLCLNRNHDCVEGCRAGRDTCRQPVEDQLDTDIAACNATRDTEVANCKSLYQDGDPQQAICITNAQVDGFQCRDQARENAKPGFQACRDGFQACATACPPAN
jgi:hypothetical protein